jgi:hypothetical protein
MAFLGTESAGYRVATTQDGLEIESWGFWTPEVASAFEEEVIAACRSVPQLLSCHWNAADMKPQAEHGRGAVRSLMILLSSLQVPDCQIVADNALTMMQFRRLARECGLTLANIRDSWA